MGKIILDKNGSDMGSLPMANWEFDWEGDDFKMIDIRKLIIYQVYMGSFFGEISSDGHNFRDIEKKLAYLKILGINAIELIIGSFRTVSDPKAQGREDSVTMDQGKYRSIAFANLVKKAHSHGIAIVMVVDILHLGPEYIDTWKLYGWPENRKEDFFYENPVNPTGKDAVPDFNRPEVRLFIRYYVLMWLEKYHCDGIRIKTDSIRNASGDDGNQNKGFQLLKEITGEIKSMHPDKLLIAEDDSRNSLIVEPLVNGGLGFDAKWDSRFIHNIRFVLAQARDEDRVIQCIVDALANTYGNSPFSRVIYCESDTETAKGIPRLPEEIHPGRADSPYAIKRSILGAVLTLTAPGIPLLLQGQEFISSTFFVGIGQPDWDRMSHLQGSQQLFADLIKMRKSDYNDFAGLQGDQLDFFHFNQQDNVLAYQRSYPDHSVQKVMVVINLSYVDYEKYIIGLTEKGMWKLVFNSSSKLYDDSGTDLHIRDFMTKKKPYDGLPYRGSFALPSYSGLLFVQYNVS